MKPMNERPITPHRVPLGRLAIAAMALGGLSASAFAVSTASAAGSKVVVSTAKNAKLGTVLVSGKTLYILKKPSKTACTAACLKVWPALVLPKGTAKATAGSGVSASKLGSVTRSGVHQVTYSGKALYTFVGDSGPGQANGDVTDKWGTWSAVVTAKSKASGSNSTATTAGSGGAGF
jgi:predicted lipoprotein with Yx(FWY)xxD motif